MRNLILMRENVLGILYHKENLENIGIDMGLREMPPTPFGLELTY